MKKVVSVVLLIFIFVACEVDTKNPFVSNSEQTLGEEASQSENVPFSNEQELSKFNGDNEIIHYKIARKLGMLDLNPEIANEYNWGSYIFSAKPVIIYGQDSRPLYYEFVVLSESKEQLGTVTINARKNSSVIVKNVFPYIRDYDGLQTKGANYRVFGDYYPTVCYYGIPSKAGDEPSVIIDPETNKKAEFKNSETAFEDNLNSFSQDELDSLGIENKDEILTDYKEAKEESKEEGNTFWAAIDSVSDKIEAISDEEIISANVETKYFWEGDANHTIAVYENLENTIWSGWCGPSALAWIYRGIYSKYNGKEITIPFNHGHEDANGNIIYKDNGLFKKLLTFCDYFLGDRPLYPWKMDDAIENVTNNAYSTDFVIRANTICNEIRDNNPVVVLHVIVLHASTHWKVAYGTKRHVDWIWQKGWWKRGWSWIPYWFPVRKETFEFKIHDNGSLMEIHGDKPYWENVNGYYYNFAMVISKKRSWWDKLWTW